MAKLHNLKRSGEDINKFYNYDGVVNKAYRNGNLIWQYFSYVEPPIQKIVLRDHLGETNNEGHSKANFYYFDSGTTDITKELYDWTGIKCLCARSDGFYTTPNADLEDTKQTLRLFEADCPNLQYISYPFGADRIADVSQSLTSCTITGMAVSGVTYIRQMFRYCTNLQYLKLGDLSKATSAEKGHFQGCTHLTTVEFEEGAKLPKENMMSGDSTSYWCWNACPLTEQSVINILNALPTGSYTLQLGSTNYAKITSAAGQAALAAARSRGWTVT